MTRIVYIVITATLLFLSSCKSEYEAYRERELASAVVVDSLIFDMHMGQTRKEFYDQCWELNRQKKVHQGGGANVKVDIPADDLYPDRGGINLLFYGAFDEEKIMRGMDFTYSYKGWAPWNGHLQADSLVQHLQKKLMLDFGGNDWIAVDLPKLERKAYIKIDGNREMLLYRKDNQLVSMRIRDLNNPLDKKVPTR